MAVGDILSVTVGVDGWWADIVVAGLSTGGTYAFGLGTNNNPATGTPKIAFTVVSMGFDDTGAATTITRTVYGTKQVRKAYPNAATNEESTGGGNVTVRVALSDYIYVKDATGGGNSGTAPTVTILSGFYTQAATPNNATTAMAVTNSSTAAYPKVVGNWSWPGLDKITGTTFGLRAVAFHSSARSGRPVRAVKFTAADTHSNTVTTTVTAATVDSTVGDAVPVPEFIATLSSSTLTALDIVTCNFVAYPWIGDTAACLDTTVGGTAQPTPLYGPTAMLNDKSATYGTSYAVVDSASGNDGTGAVSATFNAGSPPAAYATIFAAYNAVRTFNNTNYTRNNCGGSTIYLRGNASHTWLNGTPTVGTTPATWLTVTTFPGDTQATIGAVSGGRSAGLMVKLVNLNLTGQASGGTISAGTGSYMWADQCAVSAPTANQPMFYNNTVWYLTRCTITSLNQAVQPFSGVNAAPAIVRGNTLAVDGVLMYTVLGNQRTDTGNTGTWTDLVSGMITPAVTNAVVAYNIVRGKCTFNIGMGSTVHSHGFAVIQNVVEITTTAFSCTRIAADASIGNPVNNIMLWHNTMVGDRANVGYNDGTGAGSASIAIPRKFWSLKNNIFDDANIKADTFGTPDGARIGNWSNLYGVGYSGNLNGELSGISAGGQFYHEFMGLSSDQPTPTGGTQPPQGTARAVTYPKFVNRQSYNGTTTGAGGGDYRVAGDSPAVGLSIDWVLPYDIAGNARTAADPVGAYSASNQVLISSGFFALG